MATIDLRRLDSNRAGNTTVSNGTDIIWGEVLTTFSSRSSLDQVLRDLYDQGLLKLTLNDGSVAQDVSGNPYRLATNSSGRKDKVVTGIQVDGSRSKDTIIGTDRADTIRAGDGDDVLTGGGGADVQTGGRGKDTFAYMKASDSAATGGQHDTITDFNAREGDKIDLSALGRITWGGQKALGGGAASAWYTVSGSVASLFVDTDGNGTADMQIDLKGVTSIVYTDLVGVSKPATPPVTPPVNPPVTPPATPPGVTEGKPDAASITEDALIALVSGNVLSNDGSGYKLSTVNGQTVSSRGSVIKGEHGTLAIGQDGKWIYTLNNKDAQVQGLGAGETLPETFTYLATDKNGKTVTSTLTVTIKGTNDKPVAAADTAETDEATSITFTVLQNDTDKDLRDTLSVTSVKVPAGQGTATVNADGTISYDPAGAFDALRADETRKVVITYTISDSKGGTATSSATVTVIGKANGGIQVVSDPAKLDAVVGTDQVDTVILTSNSAVGAPDAPIVLKAGVENLTVEGSGALNVRANSLDNTIDLGTVTKASITIDLGNGGSDTVVGTSAALKDADIEGFGADDKLVIRDAPTVKIVAVRTGSAVLDLDTDGNGTIDASIRLVGEGLDGSKLTANDFKIMSVDSGSTITFAPVNDAPMATGGDAFGDEGTTITGRVSGTDTEGSALTYKLVAPVAGLILKEDGSYSYAAPKNASGPVTFEYVANDGELDSAPKSVTVTIGAVNEAPVAAAIEDQTFDEDGRVSFEVPTFTDSDGDTLIYTATLADGAALPTWLEFDAATRTFSGTPPADFQGALEVKVTGSDSTLSASDTFTLTIAEANDVPVAQDGTAEGQEDGEAIAGTVVATDKDGDALTYAVHGNMPAGLTFQNDGSYSYIPAKDFAGDVTFQYVANDGTADSVPATVTIKVAPVNDAPVATGGDASGNEGTIITGQVGGTDTEGSTLTYKLMAPVAGLILKEDGSYSYAAPKNASGPVTFAYVANDGEFDSAPKSVTITVGAVNEAPVAQGGTADGNEDAAEITGTLAATDEDGDTLTYSLVEGPAVEQGTLTLRADGTYSFVPAKDYNGTVSFTYKANDGTVDSDVATVTITVAAMDEPNTAPVARSGTKSGDEDTVISGNVTATDADGDALTYKLVAPVEGLTLNPNGSYSYTPAKDFNGDVEFQFVANDGKVDSAPQIVTITVTPVDEPNTAPVALAGTASGQEDGEAITGSVKATDADNDTLTYSVVKGPTAEQGTLDLKTDGSYTFTPAKDYNGAATFTYKANDGKADSDEATVTITVAAMDEPNTAPVAQSGTKSGDEDTVISGNVTATDADGDALTYKLLTPVEGLTLNPNGSYSYTPAPDFNGDVEFQFVANDGKVDSAPQTVTITVIPVDELPAGDVNLLASPTQTRHAGGTGSNDTLTMSQTNLSGAGNVINLDGTVVGTNQWAGDTISEFENITLTTIQGQAGFSLTINGDEENNTITVGDASVAAPAGRTNRKTDINGGDGNDTITYLGGGTEAQGSVLTGGAGNDTITVNSIATIEDRVSSGLSGDDTYNLNTTQGNQKLQFGANGGNDTVNSFNLGDATSADQLHFNGIQARDVLVKEIEGDTVFAFDGSTVTVKGVTGLVFGTHWFAEGELEPVNTPPTAGGVLGYEMSEDDSSLLIDTFGEDADGDALTYHVVAQPAEGTAVYDAAAGGFVFTPTAGVFESLNDGETARVSFQYYVSDGQANSAPATIEFTVNGATDVILPPPNTPPFALHQNGYEVSENGAPVEVDGFGEDPDGDAIVAYKVVSGPAKGTVEYDAQNLRFIFNPNGQFESLNTGESENVTFTYAAFDGTDWSAPGTVTVTVLGETDVVEPVVGVTGPAQGVTEGGVAKYTFTRTGDLAAPLTVAIALSGTAVAGQDYTAPAQQAVTFGAGSSVATLDIQTTNDSVDEVDKTLIVTVNDGAQYEVSATQPSATGTVLDDEVPAPALPVINATTAMGQVNEGGMATFGFTRTGDLSQSLTVNINTNIGSAKSGSDFNAPTTITFAAGQATATLDVQTMNDGVAEDPETIEVRITDGAGYTIGAGDGNVTDLMDAGTSSLPTVSINDVSAPEGNVMNFKLTFSEPPTERVTVTYQIIGDASDIAPITATFNVAANFQGTRGFNVQAIEDSIAELDETFTVKIVSVKTASGADAYQILDGEGTGTIVNDDGPVVGGGTPGVTVSKENLAVSEDGTTDTFTVVLDSPPTDNVNVLVSTGNQLSAFGPAGTSSNLVFTAQNWDVPQTITVRAEEDSDIEGTHSDGVYFQTFSNDPAYEGLMLEVVVPVTVTDNDVIAQDPPTISVADVQVAESVDGGQMVFTVTLSKPWDGPVVVEYTTANGTATAEEDYQLTTSELWFQPGDTELSVVVPVFDDGDVEGNETVLFNLTGVVLSNATIAKGSATGTLMNDDVAAALPEISMEPVGSVNEGEALTFTFTRTGNTDAPLDVSYALQTGSATAGSDFTAPSGTVTFAAGSPTATVTIQTTQDTTDELNETFGLTVLENPNYTINPGATAASTIIDNDDPVATGQTITATAGATSFVGGAGTDTLLFTSFALTGENSVSLGGAISGSTAYNGKTISGIENLKFDTITGTATPLKTLTINGDGVDNAITVVRTVRKTDINGGDGNDTIDYTGTGPEAQASVISGGTGNDRITVGSAAIIDDRVASGLSGNDAYDLGTSLGRQTLKFGTFNGNDTVERYSVGDATTQPDVLDFTGISASNITVTTSGADTIFTIKQADGSTGAVTVKGATGLVLGTHYLADAPTAPVNTAPVATNMQPQTVSEDGMGPADFGIEVMATDTNGDNLTYRVVDQPAKGSVTWDATAQWFVYNPDGQFEDLNQGDFEEVTFTYVANDGELDSNIATATVRVTGVTDAPVNTAPVALTMGPQTVSEDGMKAGDFGIEVFAEDAQNDALTYRVVDQPAKGTVTWDATAQWFVFDPKGQFEALNDGQTEDVTFTFVANDGSLDSNIATATVRVTGVTDAPPMATVVNATAVLNTKSYTGGAGSNDTLTITTTGLVAGENTINLDGSTVGTNQWAGGSIQEFENIKLVTVNGAAGLSLTINGDEENNIITVGDAALTAPAGRTNKLVKINAGAGDDTIDFIGTGAEAQPSVLSGGVGNDKITVGSAAIIDDTVVAGLLSGNDTYDLGSSTARQTIKFGVNGGNDVVKNFTPGTATNTDTLDFGSAGIQVANVTVAEIGGNTVFTVNQGGQTSTVTVEGKTGLVFGQHWTALGTQTAPLPQATTGDDTLTAVVGNAPVDGLAGNDTLVFDSFGLTATSGANVISLGGLSGPSPITGTPYAGKTITNVENITFKGVTSATVSHNLNVSGTEGANKIVVEATTEAVHLIGWGGDDVFDFTGTGTSGSSVLTGGSGNDTINAKSALNISDVGSNNGASGNDTYNLGAGAQRVDFWNANGNDTINGFVKGEDKLYFSTLNNTPANTVSVAEVNGDTVFTTSTGGTVTVKGAIGLTQNTDWNGTKTITAPAGGDPNNFDAGSPQGGSTLSEQADIFNDTAGNSAASIQGLGGNDTIYGRDGSDLIEGGAGADTIYGGSGDDRIYGEDGNDTMAGGNDMLFGGDGNDIVAGEAGDDVIGGGFGADVLNGLGGADTYVFYQALDSTATSSDTIDWQDVDTLDFRNFDFDQVTGGIQGRANPSAPLIVNSSATSGLIEDTLYYNAETGKLSLSTDADGIADFVATLNVAQEDFKDPVHPTSLAAGDFLM